jgi:uncharacterized protein YhaN
LLYLTLQGQEEERIKRINESIIKLETLTVGITEFFALFKFEGEIKLDFIIDNLHKYEALKKSCAEKEGRLNTFALEHKINPESITEDVAESTEESFDLEKIDSEIAEEERAIARLEEEYGSILDKTARLAELSIKCDILNETLQKYTRDFETVKTTVDYLKRARELLTSKYLSKTRKAFDGYISTLASEDASSFTMDTAFTVQKDDKGSLRPTESYSRGTRDLYALISRLALIDSLYEAEKPFIILDDPFAYLDDVRLERSLAALKKLSLERQIIYLTCQSSREINTEE